VEQEDEMKAMSTETFIGNMRGPVIRRMDPDYDAVRSLYNGMIDKSPVMIASCTDVADVVTAVNFARESDLRVAIRGGGHNGPGLGSVDDGLMIDMSMMKGVHVDPAACTVRAGPGCTQGDVDHATHIYGLAVPAGIVSTTGIAGLTLGGGTGYLTRKHGLTIDNLLEADVVLADGRIVTANKSENSDLYWGLRGGGGNFGVVTAIEYRLHEMDPVILGGTLVWPVSQARDVLRYYRDIALDAPDLVNLSPVLYSGPDGPVIEIEVCWSGDHAQGEAWLKKLRAFGRASHDDIAPMPYVAIQTSGDELLAAGRYYYMKTGMLTQLKDDGIDLLIDSFHRMPDWYLLFFDHCGGAYRHMAPAATAFPNRDMLFTLGTHSIWASKDGIDENTAKMRANWHELEPLTKGFYTNYVDSDVTMAGYRENYGANFERLVALKGKYDPNNLFRLNANVPPKIV
jgi:FAD/FMN-containing dehydrogenase